MLIPSIQNTLNELTDLLSQLSNEDYSCPCHGLSNATIGEHTRHIVEMFQCLENQYESGIVNYDKRNRDYRIQTDTTFAKESILAVQNQLDKPNKSLQLQQIVDGEELLIESNYNRELLYNLEHCIHHQALIKVAVLQNEAIVLDENFGVARSTIEYRKTMCTVSFVSSNGKTIITSNRDEKVHRPSAIEPKSYTINHKNIYFPKDQKAGGTWYAVSESGTVLVLLNGADEKHKLKPSYRKSRGLIVLDLISSDLVLEAWNAIDLENIEPFTLVLFEHAELFQLRWNETEKSTQKLDVNDTHIWSSSTLYPKEIREHRTQLFREFLKDKTEVSSNEMHHFHRYTEENNPENGLVINRNGELKTLSITQTVIEGNKVVLSHYDLQQQKEYTNSFITL